jgi:cytoskeletal protein CcmA (bactofilin family)
MLNKIAPAEAGEESQGEALKKMALDWGSLVGLRREAQPEERTPRHAIVTNNDGHVVVGKGAFIVGEITNCSQVEIAGALEGKVIAEAVIVRASGCLKGTVQSERAEVHGIIEGQVQIEQHLDIRSTGKVSGELAYGRLSVASGGCLAGTIQLYPEDEHEVPAPEPQPIGRGDADEPQSD